ncbi:MAG: hotdog fold thioesterase [Fulvivirga sp.]
MINETITVNQLNEMSKNTMMEHLDIEFTAIGKDFVEAKMPVDNRHHQPYGLMHGGASVTLAETLGSVAAHCSVDTSKQLTVGLEINANHIKSVRSGYVYGKATPVHIGKSTQVWSITINDEKQNLVSISRLTVSVIDKR